MDLKKFYENYNNVAISVTTHYDGLGELDFNTYNIEKPMAELEKIKREPGVEKVEIDAEISDEIRALDKAFQKALDVEFPLEELDRIRHEYELAQKASCYDEFDWVKSVCSEESFAEFLNDQDVLEKLIADYNSEHPEQITFEARIGNHYPSDYLIISAPKSSK